MAYSDPRRLAEVETLEGMRRLVAHRGPDDTGQRIWPGFALGHQRLSVIDLEGGAQPMPNEDRSVWISYNGEIYNYRDLRRDLSSRGHRFRTESDTEVLIHGYEEYGDDFPTKLDGMFACAIYDDRLRRLVLARDHLGIKPLFYAIVDDSLYFGSTIKAVIWAAEITPTLRQRSLQEYLIFRYVAADCTFYSDVQSLQAGHIAVWEDGRFRTHRYWSPPESLGTEPTLTSAVEDLEHHLQNAVERQLVADVPLGTFCSGGIDSGLVTGYAAQASPNRRKPISSFSVGFEDPEWDETRLAQQTSRRFGTEHHVLVTHQSDFAELLPRLIWYNDEPLSHPNSVPLYLLSEFARRSVKVVLTGEGADELFGGYPRYHIVRLRMLLRNMPESVLSLMAHGAGLIPDHRSKKLAAALSLSPHDAALFNSAYVSPDLVQRLTGRPVVGCLRGRREILAESLDSTTLLAGLMRFELGTYLQCALNRMDRMSMAVGLETRVPMLDLAMVEWGSRLPVKLKVRGTENKVVVRELARSMLPEPVVGGPKSGFGVPLRDWLRDPAWKPLLERLRDPGHPAVDHLDHRVVQSLLAEHQSGKADFGECLWLLLNFYVWSEQNLEARWMSAPDPIAVDRACD